MATEAHLQMIQAVISRLASQSTTIKGWCVTVTGALLGIAATATTPIVALIAIYVICGFAVLDAYYLTLERAYRTLYRQASTDQTEPWTMQVNRPKLADLGAALRSIVNVMLYGTSLLVAASTGTYLMVK